MNRRFAGIDLGWYEKPSGVALLSLEAGVLRLAAVDRLDTHLEILAWVRGHNPHGVAVDAPLVISNPSGVRNAERELNQVYRRHHAGCHAANLGMPFADRVLRFSSGLEELGLRHNARDHFQIEVHPHAASVTLFGLDRIVKYKRGLRADRARELSRFRRLLRRLPVEGLKLPSVPRSGPLKDAEDRLDAVLCAFLAAHWWQWGPERNRVFGDPSHGSIVCPSVPLETGA